MRLSILVPVLAGLLSPLASMAQEQPVAVHPDRAVPYTPTAEIRQAQKEFADAKFGIFLHWGIYSMFGQGEWYLNSGLNAKEYAKAAAGFYPVNFNAHDWVKAIKDAGAKYICITSRHHDGFSMWDTDQSDYNIVDATPFKRDVLKELADECEKQGVKLHFYYSHLDWTREDYPWGRTGHGTGRDSTKVDQKHYNRFMNNQLTELLTNYGKIGAIWFDGWWDHDYEKDTFVWGLPEQYALIHSLQPSCLIGNNHHVTPFPGEDIQIFERDLPGENKAGLSGQEVSRLPLETCETMNGMWGYKIADQNYKDVPTLVRYLVKAAGMGANLLLNIGPQPDGSLPATALDRLKGMGEWTSKYGETIFATEAGDIEPQEWGVTTRKGDRLFVHVYDPSLKELSLPLNVKVQEAKLYADGSKVKYAKGKDGVVTLTLPTEMDEIDTVIELKTK